jgi:hypothetical protein
MFVMEERVATSGSFGNSLLVCQLDDQTWGIIIEQLRKREQVERTNDI